MFEDSLFASRVGRRSRGARWTVLVSVGAQGLLVAGLVGVPLIWADALPSLATAPKVVSVSLAKAPVKVEPVKPRVVASEPGMQVPATTSQPRVAGMIARASSAPDTGEAPALNLNVGMAKGLSFGVGDGVVGVSRGSPLVVAGPVKPEGPVRVSSGVSAGLLLRPIQPVYPRIAVAARVEGTVVVTATIDKTGRIVGVQVLSGPAMLREAAAEAIREARYRPYLLNGEAVEVVTTISVVFRVGA